jgi:hypothetical protein
MDEMHTLLIWVALPEMVEFYSLPPDEAIKYSETLQRAHNRIINSDDDIDDSLVISDLVCEPIEEGEQEHHSDEPGAWAQYQVDENDLSSKGPFCQVFYSGWVL